ncbi:GNAT family N-acetyltransferase [Nocardiopsis sp. MG754419]|uniref:GNAT family N-acetyltransferase n=1 Tax=Nocardiopsis sp. MG754419 TaxID=2259865 RepID=UPI001BAAFF70|nr:GNAT family N-acetyltransferase [Nocardiopsis sp. MG754419]MBR8740864.1 GNAT family N-acetyltransferase [Nocardiopsis sp. MG754419]
MHIEFVTWEDPDGVALRARQRAEIAERYGTPDSEPGTPPSAADITVFVVARDASGTAVACGGLRDLGDHSGEVKRMYVLPAHRGSGAAARVLAALEERARSLGWRRLLLETGDRQPDAVRFYTKHRYTPVPAFGAYADAPSSLYLGREL